MLLFQVVAEISTMFKYVFTFTIFSIGMFPFLALAMDAELNLKNHAGETPLFLAVSRNNLEVVKALIKLNGDITLARNDGWTPLGIAATSNYVNLVKELLKSGAPLILHTDKCWVHVIADTKLDLSSVIELLVDAYRAKKAAEAPIENNTSEASQS